MSSQAAAQAHDERMLRLQAELAQSFNGDQANGEGSPPQTPPFLRTQPTPHNPDPEFRRQEQVRGREMNQRIIRENPGLIYQHGGTL